jgi:endonuclease-3
MHNAIRRALLPFVIRIEERGMARGVSPRRPAKSGKQAGARRSVSGTARVKANARALKPLRPSRAVVASGKSKTGKAKAGKTKRYNPLAPERIQAILKGLDQLYPDVKCALHHASAWELLVATILSAQSTDANVNRVTPVLFAKYPTVQDFAALNPEQLEPDVRSTGFFRNKSKSVVGAAKKIVSDFGGEVPDEMDKLLTLPGVARKTANVVLGSWFGQGVGVVVDTHVHRISRRWELTKNNEPVKIEQDLMKIIPQDRWISFSHQVIHHGRNLCIARKPKCADCPIEPHCHAEDKTWTTVEAHKGAKA